MRYAHLEVVRTWVRTVVSIGPGEKMLFFTTELHKNQWSQKQRFVQVEIPLCICIIFIIQQTREKLEMEGEAELA